MNDDKVDEYLPRLAVMVEPSRPVDEEVLLASVQRWWRKAMKIACGGGTYPPEMIVPHLAYPVRGTLSLVIYGGPIQRHDYDVLYAEDSLECTAEVNRVLRKGWFRAEPLEIICSGVACKLHSWDLECTEITPFVSVRGAIGLPRVIVNSA
jgi:hypothetical protein